MKKLPHLCAAFLLAATVVSLQWNSPASRTPGTPDVAAQNPSAQSLTVSSTAGGSVSSGSAASFRTTWARPDSVSGAPLLLTGVAKTPAARAGQSGRQAVVSLDGAADISSWKTGDRIHLPLPDGRTAEGTVHLSQSEPPFHRIGGSLAAGKLRGSFMLGATAGGMTLAGQMLFDLHPVAIRIDAEGRDRVRLVEVPKASLICSDPAAEASQAMAEAEADEAPDASATPVAAPAPPRSTPVPIFNGLPGARAVLYMDFDGEIVDDVAWNHGQRFRAAPPSLSDADIENVFLKVKDDFRPFNINVTTDVACYYNAPVRQRMRCIVTSPQNWAGGAGGIAQISSFAGAGRSFYYSTTVPCWAFTFPNGSLTYLAGTISHEFGHTLGLSHDGSVPANPSLPADPYYAGHGSGPTAWGPIMGSHTNPLSQWSRGEYANADNHENDLAIIASQENQISYVEDDAGNTQATAAELTRSGAVMAASGTIERNTDVDVYRLSSLVPGPLLIEAIPDAPSSSLDLAIELYQGATRVAVSSLTGSQEARLDFNVTAPGTYYLHVRGAGEGNVLGTGYSNYGSLGDYRIEGWHDAAPPAPPVSETVTDSGGTPAFAVQSFKWDGRYAVAQFPTVSGHNYRLMTSTDLATWIPSSGIVRGTGLSMGVVGSIRQEQRRLFFRIDDVPAPQAPQSLVVLNP